MKKVAVVGCTHAGTYVVKEILKEHPDTQVRVFERNEEISFLSCGIALYLGGQITDPAGLFYSNPQELRALGAEIFTQHDVTAIDTAKHTLQVKNLQNNEVWEEEYDKIVMTTGSWPVIPPIRGIESSKVVLCKNWEHAQELFKRAPQAERIAVIGAGYIGVELAEAYNLKGHAVTLVDAQERIMPKYFDEPFTTKVEQIFLERGIELALGQNVIEFKEQNGELLLKTDQNEFAVDLAILCIGFKPNTALLAGQVAMLPNGAIITNEYQQSSDPAVFAAGDSAAIHFNPTGKPAYIPLATNAIRQGRLVGQNLFAPRIRSLGTQATSGLALFGTALCSTGLTVAAAKEQGIEVAQVFLEDNYRPEFMPTTEKILMSLVYDPQTLRILGGSFLSKHDISQAANLLSVCIQNQNTIADLAQVDMLFQPHFDKPFNYLNLLGQAALAHEQDRLLQ
ncbi:FAD-dependent oxidoreductase [Liquorilactobacillus satsumensis]|nr:FAD-dependent oxidoreductase [Liquorilactobacillus satsumensis]MCP9328026.1 FAD-dependent oxidoreductase [Liquorilactobacillus satsumensis]